MFSNNFEVLDEDYKTPPRLNNFILQAPKKKAWADYSSDEDDETIVIFSEDQKENNVNSHELKNEDNKKDVITSNNKQPKRSLLAEFNMVKDLPIDKSISQLKTIDIVYVKKNGEEIRRDNLKIISKEEYERKKNLINKYKTHFIKDSVSKLDIKEQKAKIILTNALMNYCYKDPNKKSTFIYPVVKIYTHKGGSIIRDIIFNNSRSNFEVIDLEYENK